jgi:hypothetical protein
MDFTLNTLRSLLTSLNDLGYNFFSVREYFKNSAPRPGKLIILRHDVDKKPANSLAVACFEYELGIHGTYYFRIHQESFDKSIIGKIASMGHEIGYHYEDIRLALRKAKGERQKEKGESRESGVNDEEELASMAIESFRENLATLREIAPIDTICMHGSPLSHVDPRVLWKFYDYSKFGISAEPYFDISLNGMLYLTDTGRRWDGSLFSIRDKALARNQGYYSGWKRKPLSGSAMSMTAEDENLQKIFRFRKTGDILAAGRGRILPDKMMMILHPQRWSDGYAEWTNELLIQNVKNWVKYLINAHKIE